MAVSSKTALTAAGVTPPSGPHIARGVSRDLFGSLDSSSMVERLAVNEDVAGSSPAYPAKFLLPANSPDIRELAAFVFVGAFCLAVALVMTILIHIPFLDFFDLG